VSRKVFNKKLRYTKDGINVIGDINAVVASDTEPGSVNHVSTKQKTRIVQRDGRTIVDESSSETKGAGDG
jgi:hypothetical protein